MRRFFERLEQKGLTVNRFRADCGSCSEEIVEEVGKHCKTFYIRANRCGSLYDDIFALRGWKKEEPVPAKWVRTSRQYVLNIYSCNNAYADVFQNDFG